MKFTDKLEEALAQIKYEVDYAVPSSAGHPPAVRGVKRHGVAEARQQILAAIGEAVPTRAVKAPKGQPHYLEAIGWQRGYSQAIADFLTALGISELNKENVK